MPSLVIHFGINLESLQAIIYIYKIEESLKSGHKLGSYQLWLGHQKDVERHKTPDDSRNITEDVSRGICKCMYTSYNLILSVTTRKDWVTAMKSMVTTGDPVTARRDGDRGRTGWQPNLCALSLIITDYYSKVRMRVSSGAIIPNWHKVQMGRWILQGIEKLVEWALIRFPPNQDLWC